MTDNYNQIYTERELIEQFQRGELEGKKEMLNILNNLENPYPEDIFPKLELAEFQSHTINDFLCSNLRITLDSFSAEMMRRARNNLIEEIKQRLEQT